MIEAVNARDFFDHVDLAFDIHAPARNLHGIGVRWLQESEPYTLLGSAVGTCARLGKPESQPSENARDIRFRNLLTQDSAQLAALQLNRLMTHLARDRVVVTGQLAACGC